MRLILGKIAVSAAAVMAGQLSKLEQSALITGKSKQEISKIVRLIPREDDTPKRSQPPTQAQPPGMPSYLPLPDWLASQELFLKLYERAKGIPFGQSVQIILECDGVQFVCPITSAKSTS